MGKKSKSISNTIGNERLINVSAMANSDVLALYDNVNMGYDEEHVNESRIKYASSISKEHKKHSSFTRLLTSFVNPFTIVLFILAIVSIFTDVIFIGDTDTPNPTTAIIVLFLVFVSGLLKFVQETRSSNASEKLTAMISSTATVQRNIDGHVVKVQIPISEVVVGDIIVLAAGDMLPADVRILTCKDLFIRQSSLTGESAPIEKTAAPLDTAHKSSLDLNNLAFAGSNVISGSALAIVVTIGHDTHLGTIADRLNMKKPATSFEKGVNAVSWVLITFMLVMVPTIFLIVGFTKGNWIEALLFGLAVAVGLTPEMLPMIMTTGLAKGAVKLSRKKTIVKNINSIQNFGAIDILCTDKTGTLTEDRIVLDRYLDTHGQESDEILSYGILNSYFQTGMKNLMDEAILEHINDESISGLIEKYVKVDEIPFDFVRRRMTVVIKDYTGNRILVTKGAVEEMLMICSHIYEDKKVPITDKAIKRVNEQVNELNEQGMRVLAIAIKDDPKGVGEFSVADEKDLTFMGFLAFLDPPKESAQLAIAALKEYGVAIKILTGDTLNITKTVAHKVGIEDTTALTGVQIEALSDDELRVAVEKTTIFAKLSPTQKVRVVDAFRKNGHVVGFLGDGINDAAAIREADVGISVDTAYDIAKESADIVLLEKDLMVLHDGITEGRKTFTNITKYIKMTASSNFGNMFSIMIAAIFLPFLPMRPIQILILNLIYDTSCIAIPWDNVDKEFIVSPKKWNAKSIAKFMCWIGPVSSVFDIISFVLMFFVISPILVGAGWFALPPGPAGQLSPEQLMFIASFQAGWFIISLWTQTLIIHFIRTPKLPFIQSSASKSVIISTICAIVIGSVIPFIPFINEALGFTMLPIHFIGVLFGVIILYSIAITLMKMLYIKFNHELL